MEVRVSQRELLAVALDTGELACRHRRVFAAGLTLTDPAHQLALDELRRRRYAGEATSAAGALEVELRELAAYDSLIPA